MIETTPQASSNETDTIEDFTKLVIHVESQRKALELGRPVNVRDLAAVATRALEIEPPHLPTPCHDMLVETEAAGSFPDAVAV